MLGKLHKKKAKIKILPNEKNGKNTFAFPPWCVLWPSPNYAPQCLSLCQKCCLRKQLANPPKLNFPDGFCRKIDTNCVFTFQRTELCHLNAAADTSNNAVVEVNDRASRAWPTAGTGCWGPARGWIKWADKKRQEMRASILFIGCPLNRSSVGIQIKCTIAANLNGDAKNLQVGKSFFQSPSVHK